MSANQVAEHYNSVKQTGIDDRKESRIFHLRNFNNWIKSQLINEATNRLRDDGVRNPRIFDLACGKGGDLRKWDIARAETVTMADIASVSIDQAKGRYEEMRQRNRNRIFTADFMVVDCTKEDIMEKMKDKKPYDLTSCQFALHYSFVDEKSARTFIRNAVKPLRPGGIFIGTLPDAERIVWAARESEDGEFKNSVCSIRYENVDELRDGKPPLFGAKFHFVLDSQVNCPEFLAYFPLLQHLLEQEGMELLFVKTFPEAIEEWKEAGANLMGRMRALEKYPADQGEKLSGGPEEYKHVEGVGNNPVGTLSESEWQAVCMYLVFAFRKRKTPADNGKEEENTEENHRNERKAAEEVDRSVVDEAGEDVEVKRRKTDEDVFKSEKTEVELTKEV
ncbi:unnamed protein product [Caenorhabditis auriculariae]|uniref:mRNA cap guanine-N(7) methyltransferase n=1 Tax=Caenorhabditis auriculariae TaxID=2777116 RepID=A0A8S1GSU9_9PELO|nr:unnamed protein product [Caenorhabditis auriculariae]